MKSTQSPPAGSPNHADVALAAPKAMAEVVRARHLQELESPALVLAAVGIAHLIDKTNISLKVAPEDEQTAREQLRRYDEENHNWPPPVLPRYPLHPQYPPTLLTFLLLTVFFFHTGPWTSKNPYFLAGAIDSHAILEQHAWWRLLTALTLHANLVHLAGNCCIGAPIVHFLGRTLGFGTSWLVLLIVGGSANLLNLVLRHTPHHSVGFSTAVFAAIGIFTGLQTGRHRLHSLRFLLLPLGAGLALLALLGSQGEQTDLGAHFFGFACGILAGFLLALPGRPPLSQAGLLQWALLVAAFSLVIGSWLLALHQHF